MLVYQWENQNIIETYQKWYIMRLSLKTARNVWENFWYIKNDSKDWYYDILQYRTSLQNMVSGLLQEEIFIYKEDTEPLIAKLLLLDSVDFRLSQNGQLVAKMQDHEQGSG